MPGSIDVYLGGRIRELRKARRWTQADLGSIVNTRFQQIQKYEVAENRMSAAVLWRLATALGVEVQQLFEGFEAAALASAEPRTFVPSDLLQASGEPAVPVGAELGIPGRLNVVAPL